MLALVIFSLLLVLLTFFIEPNHLLCGSMLSSGLLGSSPHPLFALSLIVLFFALRSRVGFVLLIPSVVSAAMSPEAAVSIIVSSIVLFMRRYVEWMPFVLIAAAMVLIILVGLPLALLVVFALLIPLLSSIASPVWRVRAITLWFALVFVLVPILDWYIGIYRFDLLGLSLLPLPIIAFAALVIVSVLALPGDEHAKLLRALMLLLGSLLFVEVAFFAVPVIVAILAVEIRRSMGPEQLRGSRMLAVMIVVVSIVLSLLVSPVGDRDFDDALVFAPDHLTLACDGRAIPDRIGPGELTWFASIEDPDTVVEQLEEHGIRTVAYPSGFDEPIVFALRHADGVVLSRDQGLIVASLP